MRVAALYDIHCNLPALEAALRDVRAAGVDRILVGGDVMHGPLPRETMELLLSLDIPTDFIRGNCDREVLDRLRGGECAGVPEQFRHVVYWTAEHLPPGHADVIASWPLTHRLSVPGLGSVLFCHATPQNDADIFTKDTPEEVLQPIFEDAKADVVVCGHSHMQFDRMIGGTRVVNAGSVGMPYGEPGAYWLLIGSAVEFRRTDYDLEEAASRIRASGYPEADDFATNNVLQPHPESEALELFNKWAIGQPQ